MKPLYGILLIILIGNISDAYGLIINEPGPVILTDITAPTLDVTAGGTITDGPGVTLAIDGVASFNAGGNNIALDSPSSSFGSLSLTGGAVFVVESNSTELQTITTESLTLVSGNSITDSSGASISVTGTADLSGTSVNLNNASNNFGTLRGMVSESFTAVDVNNLSVGQITSANGDISLEVGGVAGLNELSGVPLLNAGSGQVSLTSGAIDLMGDVRIMGSQTTLSGFLEFDLFGVGPANYEQIFVDGDVSLDGVFQVSLNAFSPSLGETFDLLEGTNIDISTTILALPLLSGGLFWESAIIDDIVNNRQILRLTVNGQPTVPLPNTFWLFGSSLAIFMVWRYQAKNRLSQ